MVVVTLKFSKAIFKSLLSQIVASVRVEASVDKVGDLVLAALPNVIKCGIIVKEGGSLKE